MQQRRHQLMTMGGLKILSFVTFYVRLIRTTNHSDGGSKSNNTEHVCLDDSKLTPATFRKLLRIFWNFLQQIQVIDSRKSQQFGHSCSRAFDER